MTNLVVSLDGGRTWAEAPACSERIQVLALIRGYREFVTHRSRAHEYPHGAAGVVARWCGEVVS